MVYTLKLTCSGIDLRNKADAIERAVARYNDKRFQMANPKFLVLENIDEKYITITLESALPLSTPGKALRSFSMDLIQNEAFQASASGQLFRTQLLSSETDNQTKEMTSTALAVKNLSDSELLKGLVEYIINKSASTSNTTEYRRKRTALEYIKQIAIESGIITADNT